MKFSYQARSEEGEVKTGTIEASSREGALNVLQKYGLYVTYLTRVKQPFWQKKIGFLSEASKSDIVFFTRQLAIMLKASIPVVESFETIARQVKKTGFQEKILKMSEQVEGGSSLSQALSSFPGLFSPFFIGMVKSGETSGRISESLEYLADYLEKEQDFKSKFVGAIIYPVFVLVVFLGLIFVMGIFVVPKFGEVFAETGSDLPWLTKTVITLSSFMKDYWYILIFLIFSSIIGLFFFFKSRETKEGAQRILLEMPLIGEFLKKVYLSRIALNLSTLIAGGVPISQALEITSGVVGSNVYEKIILATRDGVRAGKSISSVLASYPKKFPLLFIQMTMVGEKAGHLDKSLENLVTFYQKEVDRALDSFIKFLEPVLILVLGVLVAGLALSLFVPLFQKGLMV